jgi:hypothetical protein
MPENDKAPSKEGGGVDAWRGKSDSALAEMAPQVGAGFKEGAKSAMTQSQWSAIGDMVTPSSGLGFGKSYGAGFVNGMGGSTVNVTNIAIKDNVNSRISNVGNRKAWNTKAGDGQNRLRAKNKGTGIAEVRKLLSHALERTNELNESSSEANDGLNDENRS